MTLHMRTLSAFNQCVRIIFHPFQTDQFSHHLQSKLHQLTH
uniref:Uncharacterized protein n=1 Tax=Anguilla anguilla TaxID=7936 RepID=A0A0E9PPK2_ANGAN